MEISKLFLTFIIYSILGWIIEVINFMIRKKKFINRGFLIGPYCPIYGVGGILITLFLSKYKESVIVLFVMAVFICGILEYFTSYLMEKIFKARWWDYSSKRYNINGRICLETLSLFGIMGILVVYLLEPLVSKFFSYFNVISINILAIIFTIIFILDLLLSFKVISSFKNISIQFKNKDNTEEITRKVRETLSQKSPFTKRLVDAFPTFKSVLINIKNELKRTKDELKGVKKELKKTQKKLKKIENKTKKK